MQPNFAFETTAALEMIPQSRPAKYLAPHSPSRQKNSIEPSSADRSHRSFKSSLREASKGQENKSRSKPVDDSSDDVQRPDREMCAEKVASKKPQAQRDDGADTVSDQSVVDTDRSSSDQTAQDLSPSVQNEEEVENKEEVDNELAGSGAVTADGNLAEAADLGPATDFKSENVGSAVAANATQPATTPGEMSAGDSGSVSADQRGALAGQNDGTLKIDSGLKVDIANTEMSGSAEKAPPTSLKTSNGTEAATAEEIKGLNEWVKAEAHATPTASSKLEGLQGPAAGAGPQTGAPDRSTVPLQPLCPALAEQGASGLKSQPTKTVQTEETGVTRASEVSGDQQSAGRIQSDLMQGREGEIKNEAIAADEVAPKVAKMNPGAKDGAFMQYQDQNFERLMEPATAAREKEASPSLLRTQTIDQIVNKAVYQIRDGQNSVRIDLKPEFLGQVRMQIVTVDQQVSIRISAELPVVKEMLENNLQQLKADLQQQGLEVDEIQVSVSTDSRDSAQNQKMKSDLKPQHKTSAEKDGVSGVIAAPETTRRHRTSNLAVDMFV